MRRCRLLSVLGWDYGDHVFKSCRRLWHRRRSMVSALARGKKGTRESECMSSSAVRAGSTGWMRLLEYDCMINTRNDVNKIYNDTHIKTHRILCITRYYVLCTPPPHFSLTFVNQNTTTPNPASRPSPPPALPHLRHRRYVYPACYSDSTRATLGMWGKWPAVKISASSVAVRAS